MKRFRINALTNTNEKFHAELDFANIYDAIAWANKMYTYFEIEEVR